MDTVGTYSILILLTSRGAGTSNRIDGRIDLTFSGGYAVVPFGLRGFRFASRCLCFLKEGR